MRDQMGKKEGRTRSSNVFRGAYPFHDDLSRCSFSTGTGTYASSAHHSIESDLSSLFAPQRRCPLCPMLSCSNSSDGRGSYIEIKRDMEQLINSKDQLHRAEIDLESEKSKGRLLLVACVVMSLLCAVIFMDRLPKDWKTSVINRLDKDGKTRENNYVADHSKAGIRAPSISSNTTVGSFIKNSVTSSVPTYTPIKLTKFESEPDLPEGTDELLVSVLDKRVSKLSFYNRWNIPFLPRRETPVFWHIPRAGGGVVDDILGRCYKVVQAADDPGLIQGHETETELAVFGYKDKGKYFNVNMGTREGIKRANDLKLSSWPTPIVIRTPYLFETAGLFHPGRYGKCFAVLRHPVERAMDVFQNLKDTNQPVFVNMTLLEYAKSPYCEANWMVRFLTDEMEHSLTQDHLDMAQHVLGRKCVVGFTEKLEESIHRFARFFKWDRDVSVLKVRDCLSDIFTNDPSRPFSWRLPLSKDPKHGSGSEVWNLLEEKNDLDMKLYNYGKKLFDSQTLYMKRL